MFVSEGTVQHRTELVNIIWPPVGRQCLSRTFTGPSRPTALSGRELDGRTKGGAVAESMMAIKPERSRRMGGRTTHGLPFAAKDPLRVIPSLMLGSAIAGGLSMVFGCQLLVPHGGIFAIVIPGAATNLPVYLLAIVIGSLVTAAAVAVLKALRPVPGSTGTQRAEKEHLATA